MTVRDTKPYTDCTGCDALPLGECYRCILCNRQDEAAAERMQRELSERRALSSYFKGCERCGAMTAAPGDRWCTSCGEANAWADGAIEFLRAKYPEPRARAKVIERAVMVLLHELGECDGFRY